MTIENLVLLLDAEVRNKTEIGSLTPANEADAILRGYQFTKQEILKVLYGADNLLPEEALPELTDEKALLLFNKLLPLMQGKFALLGSGGTNAAPTATVGAITGTTTVGQTLTGPYVFADAENNPEGASLKQWYKADTTTGTNRVAISGATSSTYTLVAADQGKYIQFGVVPVATTGTTTGTQVVSGYTTAIAAAPVSGNNRPSITSATITGVQELTVTFSEAVYGTYPDLNLFADVNQNQYLTSAKNGPEAGNSTIVYATYGNLPAGHTVAYLAYTPGKGDHLPNAPQNQGIYSVATGLELQAVVSLAVTNNLA